VELMGRPFALRRGAKLKAVAMEAKRAQLTGLEFFGRHTRNGRALGRRMNAGAMGGWMFDVVESIRYMDYGGEAHEQSRRKCRVEYRSCPLLKDHIAMGAVLKGHRLEGLWWRSG